MLRCYQDITMNLSNIMKTCPEVAIWIVQSPDVI
ncbi:unnamed protein product [Gongylonema pulchrum]|uniref:Uncharacterized protein n=1 Tax=Gongylonema pulchrum TaxID=637853 RepID=A0A3P6NUR0_9BILA|nr:unnamed protein product [Gongylonema pulchrum]